MPLPTPQDLHRDIAAGLHCTHLDVQGDDGQHFFATIVSPQFIGKTRVQRHQLVYAALGERMRADIHALSMKTLTPEEFAAQSAH
ncbi:BolA/IbaG family iron-sulfur metabolism protein [Thiomonas sp.]|uniref:BolA family protein n=1 Tax=Thiomonas sp. TaxID=2047785 RepID=UPI00260D988D|nr:BolA/IbaG family iron-sulfur metabolism protein [Thiomonas sp.]